jgi:hypothetical protein
MSKNKTANREKDPNKRFCGGWLTREFMKSLFSKTPCDGIVTPIMLVVHGKRRMIKKCNKCNKSYY